MNLLHANTKELYQVDLPVSGRQTSYPCPEPGCTGESKPFRWNPEKRVGKCYRCGTVFYQPTIEYHNHKQYKSVMHQVIPAAQVQVTLGKSNLFLDALRNQFDHQDVEDILRRFQVGTLTDGRLVWWYIDNGHPPRARYGKVMRYSGLKRDKQNPGFNTMHNLLDLKDHKVCFFGQNQLRDIPPGMPVNIVESEKTAIISTLYVPGEVWLATGGAMNLDRLLQSERLGERILWLYPDLDKVEEWDQVRQRHRKDKEVRLAHWWVDFWVDCDVMPELIKQNPSMDVADFLLEYEVDHIRSLLC